MVQELRIALRRLARARNFSLTVLVALAIGVGACAAIFTVVHGVLLAPLPYRHPGRLVLVKESIPPFSPHPWAMSAPDIGPLRQDQRVFSAVASFGGTAFDLSGGGAGRSG